MTTATLQHNLRLSSYNISGLLAGWQKSRPVLFLASSLLIVVMMLTLAGGVLFWGYELSSVFAGSSNSSGQTELQVAESGLQNVKRMVGDQRVWSESIQNEYNKLFANQSSKTQPVVYTHEDNFIGPSNH